MNISSVLISFDGVSNLYKCMNHGKGHNMIIFDFLKELEKYVDLTMLSQLSTESVEKLTNYFNDNNIYEKMNLLHAN